MITAVRFVFFKALILKNSFAGLIHERGNRESQ